MAERLNILQVNTADDGGGAEKLARSLFQAYRARGYDSWLAVGHKHGNDPNVLLLPNDVCRDPWARTWISIGKLFSPLDGRVWGAKQLRYWLPWVGQLARLSAIFRGHEDFDYPATQRILDLPMKRPDIVHCHNLHGDYFDLRCLPQLSQEIPLILSLHDAWLLSGHCAHSMDCDRWKTGCGECPDLTLYPAVRRDATAYNWKRKGEIFTQSKLHVSTPCRWLMEKVKQSIMMSGVAETRIIPHGVDLTTFHATDSLPVRQKLGLPFDAKVILFVANNFRKNIWKDYQILKSAVALAAEKLRNLRIIFLAVGENTLAEQMGRAEVHFIAPDEAVAKMSFYYQAADIYVHAAKVDTFPNTILEALACGTPVVATGVGGIPEQVKGLNKYGINGGTGILVPSGDSEAMAVAIEGLLNDKSLCLRLGENAAQDAKKRFDLNRQVDDYLAWYEELIHANLHRNQALV